MMHDMFRPSSFSGINYLRMCLSLSMKKTKDLYDVTHPDSPFLASHAQKVAFVWPSLCEVQPTMHLVLAARVSFSAFLQEVAPTHLIGKNPMWPWQQYGYGSIPIFIPFLVGYSHPFTSYFDVNYRGTIGFDTLPYITHRSWWFRAQPKLPCWDVEMRLLHRSLGQNELSRPEWDDFKVINHFWVHWYLQIFPCSVGHI